MALVAFLIGGVVGVFSAIVGLFFGLSLLSCFGLYMAVATVVPLILIFSVRHDDTGPKERDHLNGRMRTQSA